MNMKKIMQKMHTSMLVKHINNHHYSRVLHISNAVMWLFVCVHVRMQNAQSSTSCLMACMQFQLDS